eukprot:NODE_4331_length_351_cov_375.016556_g3731_i0.p1 GENE.NODE_4331_length_351_cov_375.016556_g3731_i0~~NODE_4331_length_351_cov_375.016556_g3731_i0.p1  ORF type:complete len:98 (-),score=8.36 NODE_4331_length_351_cov_375.016556_g3731_i0:25-318(-)
MGWFPGEVTELAGCDRMTIGPKVLDQMAEMTDDVPRKLCPTTAQTECTIDKLHIDEPAFRWMMLEDQAGGELLNNTIRMFNADIRSLEERLRLLLQA